MVDGYQLASRSLLKCIPGLSKYVDLETCFIFLVESFQTSISFTHSECDCPTNEQTKTILTQI